MSVRGSDGLRPAHQHSDSRGLSAQLSVDIYDTTLRDGSQQEGLSLTVDDKLRVAAQLDHLGVAYIEGGWPGANPKDNEFFQRAPAELKLETATLVAFGSTRRPHAKADNDGGCSVANTLTAVRQGATQVQGCINGYGERTGNADLCAAIPDLTLKMGVRTLGEGRLERLTPVAHHIAELVNIAPHPQQPY